MKTMFQKLEFIGARCKPPSQEPFIRTLYAVERLFLNLEKQYNIESLSTRRINQNPLENCFGCIRSNCGSSPNPNTQQFVAALKTSIVNNLLNSSKNRNCTNVAVETFDMTEGVEASNTVIPQCSAELQACAYVFGFMIKKLVPICNQCKITLLADQNTEVSHLFTSFKEYNCMRNSLHYVNNCFTETVEIASTIVNKFLDKHRCNLKIKSELIEILKRELKFDWLLGCSDHYEKNKMHIIISTISICLKRHYILKNRQYVDEASKKAYTK